MIHSDSLTRKVVEYVKTHPGSTRSSVLQVIPEAKPRSISSILNHLARTGAVENRGRAGRSARWYAIDISVKTSFRVIARQLLGELKGVHHSQREAYLAKRLEEIFSSYSSN